MSMPTPSTSVIHPHPPHTMSQDEIISEDEARKRREFLERRPSYRKILNDLSEVDRMGGQMKKEPSDNMNDNDDNGPMVTVTQQHNRQLPTELINVHPPLTSMTAEVSFPGCTTVLTLPNGDVNLTNLSLPSSLLYGSGAVSIANQMTNNPLQEASPSSLVQQHVVLPVNANDIHLSMRPVVADSPHAGPHSNNSGVMSYVNQGLMSQMGSSGYISSPSPVNHPMRNETGDEVTRKRQLRLLKNREAAKECRRKKKEYVKCLENRVAVLENQNKALIEELKTLKDLYCRKDKGQE